MTNSHLNGSRRWPRFTVVLLALIAGSNLALAQTQFAVSRLAGQYNSPAAADGASTVARFNNPQGPAVDSAGNMYVADTSNHTVRKVTPTGTVTTVAGLAGTPGVADGTGGTGGTARFNNPRAVALNPAGTTLFVADAYNHTIRAIDLTTTPVNVTTLAGSAGVPAFADATGAAARFNFPSGVISDGTNVYVADTVNQSIRRIVIATGAVTTLAGPDGTGANTPGTAGFVDATGAAARFSNPVALAIDSTRVFVADRGNNRIRAIAIATGAVTTLAGTGIAGSADAPSGPATSATFNSPSGVAVDSTGSTAATVVFVTEAINHTVRRIVLSSGAVSTAAGTVGVTGSADGVGSAARFNSPNGIALDPAGNFYVADTVAQTVRKGAPAAAAGITSANNTTFTRNVAGTFTVTATGAPAATFTITSGSPPTGVTLTSNAGVNTATLAGTPTGAAGNYTFTIQAANGVTPPATQVFTLTVQQTPQITSAASTSFAINSPDSFQVTATGFPAPTFSIASGTLPGDVAELSLSGLLTSKLPTSTAGSPFVITIRASNTAGTADQVFTLNLVMPTPPVVTGPTNQTVVPAATTATFSVTATGAPSTFTYQWQRALASSPTTFANLTNGTTGGFTVAGATTATLNLSGVAPAMNGDRFQVVVTNSAGPTTSSVATLTVQGVLPTITANPANTVVAVGANAVFTAAGTGNPVPTLRWQRAVGTGPFADLSDDTTYVGTATGTLTVRAVTGTMHGDRFRLVATNVHGFANSAEATLSVSSTMPAFAVSPLNTSANVGANPTFTVTVLGSPAPTIRWQRQRSGTTSFVDLTDDGVFSGVTTSTLTILGAAAEMNGDRYRVVATNAYGTAVSSSAILTVTSTIPAITTHPVGLTASVGQNVTFVAGATANPAPTLRWQRRPAGSGEFADLSSDGVYGGTSSGTLTISGVTLAMNGDQFRLVATNDYGSTSSTAATLLVSVGTTFTTIAGQAGDAGAVNGVGTNARFNSPSAVAMAAGGSGTIYIADPGNHVIRRIIADGTVTTVAGQAGVSGSTDGSAGVALFSSPQGIAVDASGNIYVADTSNHAIRLINTNGDVSTLAGSPGSSGAIDGVGSAARFSVPTGIAVDASGNIYVADSGNHAIRRVQLNGTVSTFAGAMGASGFVNSAVATGARFNMPTAVAADADGAVYVADSLNHSIRKIAVSGTVTTLAGSGVAGGTDGTGAAASFNLPRGLAVSSNGYVFVTDTNLSTIRRVGPAGDVSTIGGQAGYIGSADGVGSVARFYQPQGIAVDSAGTLFVADTRNHTIRRGSATLAVAPQITTQPVSRTAAPGGSATFTVVATGTPAPTYQWQRAPVGDSSGFVDLVNDETYSGVTTSQLVVSAATSGMTGDQFRVMVSNGVAPAAQSEAVTLRVGVAPVFTSATTAAFQAERTGSFTVRVTSSIAATFSATGLPSWATLDANTGVISGTPPNTTGSPFTVTVTANNGLTANQTLTITVAPATYPPSFTAQPGSVSVNQGQSATFTVSVSGTAPFTYQWRRNEVPLVGATGPSLVLSNVQPSAAGAYSVLVTNSLGSVTSGVANLTVNTPPLIALQPHAQTSLAGSTVIFTVSASGGAGLSYQWRRNGAAIAGANSPTLTLTNVSAADAGLYDVQVTNAVGSLRSSTAQLTIATVPLAPVIIAQPASRTALAGTPTIFGVGVNAAPTASYQWRKNGANIAGATGPTYAIESVQAADAGTYDVVVSNSLGSVTSTGAVLRVVTHSHAGFYFGSFSGGLGNFALYVRPDNTGVFLGYLPGSVAPVMNLSVVVADNGTFTFMQDAIASVANEIDGEPPRAASLGGITVNGTIFNGMLTGSMSGGAGASFLAMRAPDVGTTQSAAGFYQAGAGANAATLLTLAAPDGRAMVVAQRGTTFDGGLGSLTGAGLVTVNTGRSNISATILPAGTITGVSTGAIAGSFSGGDDAAVSRQRLLNISSRARVGAGEAVAIAGFVISGEVYKPVLIRGVGPTLGAAPFNVPGALTAPRLELFQAGSDTPLLVNSGIGANRAAIDAAGAQSGAFALASAGTDAAILTTLAPGNYTAVLSSATAASGVGLVEVYDLSAIEIGQKLLNISTRASAGTAENTLIAGFVIPPGTAKRVLVRGIGPGLAPFGLGGVLPQPTLTLLRGSTTVAQNTTWSTSPDASAISLASAQVGGFGLAPQDAALVVTLVPGDYTAQVTGAGGATGIALIEVYELP